MLKNYPSRYGTIPAAQRYEPRRNSRFGSLVYNCGPGVLRGRNKTPTELSAAFARYKKDGREEDKNIVKKLINAKIYAKGRALPQLRYRRDLETRILFGDIVLDQAKADSLNNALDLSAVSIGGIYTIGHKNGGLPKDSTELVNRIANTPGQNLQDTLRQAFTPNVPKVIIRKRPPAPAAEEYPRHGSSRRLGQTACTSGKLSDASGKTLAALTSGKPPAASDKTLAFHVCFMLSSYSETFSGPVLRVFSNFS